MMSHLKITLSLLERTREDLRRPHSFAQERVGFITCRFARTIKDDVLLLAHDFYPVADDDYVDDRSFGAVINAIAIRKAMQLAYTSALGIFHTHLHDHLGEPQPSNIDVSETRKFVPDFRHVRPTLPHGAVVLSNDSISGRVWLPGQEKPTPVSRISVIGAPMSFREAHV